MDFGKIYMDTPARTYVDFGVVIHKDKFYVYPDSNDIWYKLAISKGRSGSRELFINSNVANHVDQDSRDKIVKADLTDSDNFRECVGTELTPDNPDISRYYKALNNIPTSIHITFSNVYVDVLTVIELSRFGTRAWQTLKTYAIRNVHDGTLAGYVSASIVNGVLNSTHGSDKHNRSMSTLRKFIRQVTPGEIEAFGGIRRWSNGEFVVTAHYPTPAEDAAEDIYYKWHATFIDATLALDDEVKEPAEPTKTENNYTDIEPMADGVIQGPESFTIKNKHFRVNRDALFKVGDYPEPYLMITVEGCDSVYFIPHTQRVSKFLRLSDCISGVGVTWSRLSVDNCPDYLAAAFDSYVKRYEATEQYIVTSKFYIDLSDKYVAEIPLHGNRKPNYHIIVYKVNYFDGSEPSYLTCSLGCNEKDSQFRHRIYKLLSDEPGPGHLVTTNRAVHRVEDVSIHPMQNYYIQAELLAEVNTIKPAITAVDDTQLGATLSVNTGAEELYECIVPRLDSIDRDRDEISARIKECYSYLQQLRNLIEDGHTAAVTQHKVINDNTRQCLEAISKGNHVALESAKEEINKRFDTMSDKFESLGAGHSMMLEVLHKTNKSIDVIKAGTAENRTAIQGVIDVFDKTLNALDKESAEVKGNQLRIESAITTLICALRDVIEYQERILQNQERKGFWNWLKSLFKK